MAMIGELITALNRITESYMTRSVIGRVSGNLLVCILITSRMQLEVGVQRDAISFIRQLSGKLTGLWAFLTRRICPDAQ